MDKPDLSYFREQLNIRYRELAPLEYLQDSDSGRAIKFDGIPATLRNRPEFAKLENDGESEESHDTFLQRLYTYWSQLDEALDRMKLGTYGACTRCGDEISRERLEDRPYVRFCRSCELQE